MAKPDNVRENKDVTEKFSPSFEERERRIRRPEPFGDPGRKPQERS